MDQLPENNSPLKWAILILGLSFLYIPILVLIVYSFNDNKLVTVWSGFSFRWYAELFSDQALMDSVQRSLSVAALAATAAVIIGTIAAFVLTRFNHFRGKSSFNFMINVPLVMPDVITGLALMLLFIALGQFIDIFETRGLLTVWIAHTTLCTAFVTVVIRSRLTELDRTIEEAAQDLGAKAFSVFAHITLPSILPAIISAWLLAFTISLDDLVIASFVSGPGATTLPMQVFSSIKLGLNPKINALASIMILVVFSASFLGWRLMAKAEKSNAMK